MRHDMNIFAFAINMHDHNTYDGTIHRQVERHTRLKHNLNPGNPHDPTPSQIFFKENFRKSSPDQIAAFTCSNLGYQFVSDLVEEELGETDFLNFRPTHLWENYHTKDYYYIDHHQSHAAYAFLSSEFAESDILAIDGRGWQFNCIFINKEGSIMDLSKHLSVGGLWNRLSQDIGLGYLGAGKTMGLAGYGAYRKEIQTLFEDYLSHPNHKLPGYAKTFLHKYSREDIARTLQDFTVDLITRTVYPLKTSHNLCVAGGVAYNGYLNEEFTKEYKEVHIPPAVGDEGQALGVYMHADFVLNKNRHIPATFSGVSHEVDEKDFLGSDYQKLSFEEIYNQVSHAIAGGAIVGWYQGESASGNRALGNRSILADPRNPNIKDIINQRIKKREDFRPFAPTVLVEYYDQFFDTNQPSPFMSRIMPVISDKIPGVTHVDGTARIQTLTRDFNEKFYDLINAFYKITGIPMLLNTSFNCREPIVESPSQAYETFMKTDLDLLVIGNYLIRKPQKS
jgi:carbamoyltransferase